MADGTTERGNELIRRFHDPRILAATGRGIDIEEPHAWKGYWNESLVEESRRLFNDPEVLTVLLTGRSTLYVEVVNRILASRQLNYDLVVLKPKKARGANNNTLTFKYAFMDDVLRLGKSIVDVEVYEDRALHRDAFDDYLKKWRRIKETETEEVAQDGITMQLLELEQNSEEVGLKSFKVHFITMPMTQLDPQAEEALVKTMVDETNAADMAEEDEEYVLDKKVFSLGYQLDDDDFKRIFDTYMALATEPQATTDSRDWRPIRQSSVFIYFNALPHILDRVGGIGKQVDFEITHFGVSNKAMALALSPVASYHEVTTSRGETKLKPDSRMRFWTKNELPVLVLATKDGGKPTDANFIDNWMAIPESIKRRNFRATVALRQEITIERISKENASERKELTPESPRKRNSFPPLKERTSGQTSSRAYGARQPEYGRGQNNPRNAFGYSLS